MITSKLILLRHLESQWNEENRFSGWVDVPLAEGVAKETERMAKELSQFKIDVIYCSCLFRNMDTVARVLEYDKKYPLFIHLDPGKMKDWGNFKDISDDDIPAYVTEKLNERYYGKLQGLNKSEIIKEYGEEKVKLWRRSFKIAPPGGESLKDVCDRVVPFYRKYIENDLKKGKNVLVVASHNSLRALVKHINNISDEEIVNFEISQGGVFLKDFRL